MQSFLIVFVGAGIGGALRHGVNVAAAALVGTTFPFGTLLINVAGALVMGILTEWFALKFDPGLSWRLFLTTGLMGGFTTFSAFSLEMAVLVERGAGWPAAAYVLLSVVLSIAALFAGLILVRHLV